MKRTLTAVAMWTTLLLLGASLWPTAPMQAQSQPYLYFVPPSACTTVVSGNSTGTNGQTTAGASSTPVVQAQTSASGTNTHTYICNIAPPVQLAGGGSTVFRIQNVVFLYGVQTTGLGTQVNTLASGTFNSSVVFSSISYPPPGSSETASTVTPARADTGTLAVTPAAASFNTTTTTAGAFFSQTFQPAVPITWSADMKQLLLTVTLQAAATSATITNSPGVIVHVLTQ